MHTWLGSEWKGQLSSCQEPGRMPGPRIAHQEEGPWRASLEGRDRADSRMEGRCWGGRYLE